MTYVSSDFSTADPTLNWDNLNERVARKLTMIGRTAYKSEKETPTFADDAKFVQHLVWAKHHLSVIEHVHISVKIICDRGVSHELVRHRIAAYTQESTRYCNYAQDKFAGQVVFIAADTLEDQKHWPEGSMAQYIRNSVANYTERAYLDLINLGVPPQLSRDVLPNMLKTEVWATYNLHEWMHVFEVRCAEAAHPRIRAIMSSLLEWFQETLPVVFVDVRLNME